MCQRAQNDPTREQERFGTLSVRPLGFILVGMREITLHPQLGNGDRIESKRFYADDMLSVYSFFNLLVGERPDCH